LNLINRTLVLFTLVLYFVCITILLVSLLRAYWYYFACVEIHKFVDVGGEGYEQVRLLPTL